MMNSQNPYALEQFTNGSFDALEFGWPNRPGKAPGSFRVLRRTDGFVLSNEATQSSGMLVFLPDDPTELATVLAPRASRAAAAGAPLRYFGVCLRKSQ